MKAYCFVVLIYFSIIECYESGFGFDVSGFKAIHSFAPPKVQQTGDRCITPNKENASCIELLKCGVISEVLLELVDTPKLRKVREFAKASMCKNSIEQLVCCGSRSNFLPEILEEREANGPENRKIEIADISNITVCGISWKQRIIGGDVTQPGEFPWMAGLEFKDKNNSLGILCGGSLITNRYVLTAAHCIHNPNNYKVAAVWLGAYNISSSTSNCKYNDDAPPICGGKIQVFKVEESHIFQKYFNTVGQYDIGLIRLDRDVEFQHDYIMPLCLPHEDTLYLDAGTPLTVTGWGVTNSRKGSKISQILLEVEVPLMSQSDCNKFLVNEEPLSSPSHICAGGEEGKDSCQGDSGGPLTFQFRTSNNSKRWYQEGIVSRGMDCAVDPGIYTKVSKYIPWISQTIRTFELKYWESSVLPNRNICGMQTERRRRRRRRSTDDKIESYEFPWMVALQFSFKNGSFAFSGCGATLITNQYLLSPAYCLSINNLEPSHAVFRQLQPNCIKEECMLIKLEKQLYHPQFNKKTLKYMIAVLKLATPVEFNDYIKPVCLPPKNLPSADIGSNFIITAAALELGNKTIEYYEDESVTSLGNSACLGFYGITASINLQEFVCVGSSNCIEWATFLLSPYADPNTTYYHWYLEGVGTYNPFCIGYTVPSFHTKVSFYIDWIIDVIKKN